MLIVKILSYNDVRLFEKEKNLVYYEDYKDISKQEGVVNNIEGEIAFRNEFSPWFNYHIKESKMRNPREILVKEDFFLLSLTSKRFLETIKKEQVVMLIQEYLSGLWKIIKFDMKVEAPLFHYSNKPLATIREMVAIPIIDTSPEKACKSYIRFRDLLNFSITHECLGIDNKKRVIWNCIVDVIFKSTLLSMNWSKVPAMVDKSIPSIRVLELSIIEKKRKLNNILNLISVKNKDVDKIDDLHLVKKQKI